MTNAHDTALLERTLVLQAAKILPIPLLLLQKTLIGRTH